MTTDEENNYSSDIAVAQVKGQLLVASKKVAMDLPTKHYKVWVVLIGILFMHVNWLGGLLLLT